MKKAINVLFAIGVMTIGFCSASYGQDSTAVKKMLGEITFGIPSSPAFELLPNKPSEVTHLTSAKDITAHFNNFISGGKLQSGAAVDVRPFTYTVGSLTEYQNHPVKRILWRTVFSVGTASKSQTNSDIYLGAGLRIPIVDNGDLRKYPEYTELLESFKLLTMGEQPQPDFGETSQSPNYKAKLAKLKNIDRMDSLRNELFNSKWNAFRLDLGIGASSRAASGLLKPDSLFKDRAGLWLATALPVTKKGQLTVSGNTAWIKTKSDTSESSRIVVGARLRFFMGQSFALSGEYARIYSRHSNQSYDENWNHMAIVAEFKMPLLGGWGSVAYGGDSGHRTDASARISFNYAFYTDRMIKK